MLQFTDLWDLEKKRHFRLLSSLETLKFRLGLDSNPGPCASQPDLLSNTPICLIKFFPKNSSHIFAISQQQCRKSAQRAIGSFFRKDKKQEMLISFDLDRIFQWNFQNVCESTKSNFFIIIFPLWKLVGKKVNYTNTHYNRNICFGPIETILYSSSY